MNAKFPIAPGRDDPKTHGAGRPEDRKPEPKLEVQKPPRDTSGAPAENPDGKSVR